MAVNHFLGRFPCFWRGFRGRVVRRYSPLHSPASKLMLAGMAGNTERATAGRNLLMFSALVAVAAGYTVMLWIERPQLEGYAYPTGLGDGEVYDVDARPLDPETPMALLDGVGYFASKKPQGHRDRYMAKVARDDADQLYFYRVSKEIGGGGKVEDADLYLKLASDQYIKVSPAATGGGAAVGP
jgi:hypothetical protein